jgi:NAD+ kinase
MATVALLAYPGSGEPGRLAVETAKWLSDQGHRARILLVDAPDQVAEEGALCHVSAVDLSGVDLAVSLGGDGTFLRMVPLAHAARVPILGVNFGRLGYLLHVHPEELTDALAQTLSGDMALEDRAALSVTVTGELTRTGRWGVGRADTGTPDGEADQRGWIALNEMVAEKTVPGHMVHLATAIDGEPVFSYAADGVIVATATGSTAYNLSAGGPVLSPRLRALVLTPVAPFLSIDRSIVIPPDQAVTVQVLEERPAVLVIDGREVGRLAPGAEITCRIAPDPVHFVSTRQRGFAERLRETLALDRER